MMKYKSSKTIRVVAMIMMVSAISLSCSNSTDSDNAEPPAIPDLDAFQPSLDFFNQQPTAKLNAADPTNFLTGATYATIAGGLFQAFSQLGLVYIELAENVEPTLDGDTWVWSYSYGSTAEGSVGFELRATVVNDNFLWELFFSAEIPGEVSFTNEKFMEGTAASDGLTGSWSIFPFLEEDESAIATYEWNFTNESEGQAIVTFFDSGIESGTITYTVNGDDNTIEYASGGETFTIFWNETTNVGYYIYDGMRYCWDASLQNTACTV